MTQRNEDQPKRRRRGRRGGGGRPSQQDSEVTQSTHEPYTPATSCGDAPTEDATAPQETTRARRERNPIKSRASADVNPMDFWRSGRARSHREESITVRGQRRSIMYRLTHPYIPPWAPVAFIIVVTFGILGLLFYTRSATGAPRQGDHWHSPYKFIVCGEAQQPLQTYEAPGGNHTHGDGITHRHPFGPQGEGQGASVGNWTEAEGGKLTGSELRVPQRREGYKAGEDTCDGEPAEVRVLMADSGIHPLGGSGPGQSFSDAIVKCDALPPTAYKNVGRRYIPKDGECIRIVFGPPDVEPVVEADRTIIDPGQATRTVDMVITGTAGSIRFVPASFEARVGETVEVALRNETVSFHGLRFSGTDGEFGTSDDYVTGLPTLEPGEEATAIIRFDAAGRFDFRDDVVPDIKGSITVSVGPEITPSPTPRPEELVELSVDVTAGETFFEPPSFAVSAGEEFAVNLRSEGRFVHNMRIAGADGQFETDDDIVSPDVPGSGQDTFVAQLDKPGSYAFRCDFHPTEHSGTIVVE